MNDETRDALFSEGYRPVIAQATGFMAPDGELWPVEFGGHGHFAATIRVYEGDLTGWMVIGSTYTETYWYFTIEGAVPATQEQIDALREIAGLDPESTMGRKAATWADTFERRNNQGD